jgi:hypothetical protein
VPKVGLGPAARSPAVVGSVLSSGAVPPKILSPASQAFGQDPPPPPLRSDPPTAGSHAHEKRTSRTGVPSRRDGSYGFGDLGGFGDFPWSSSGCSWVGAAWLNSGTETDAEGVGFTGS